MWYHARSCARRVEKRSSGIKHRVSFLVSGEGERMCQCHVENHILSQKLCWGRGLRALLLQKFVTPNFSLSFKHCNTFLQVYSACAENAVGLWNEVVEAPTSCFCPENLPSPTPTPRSARPRKLGFVPCNPKLPSIYNQRRKGLNSVFLLWK